MAAKVVMVAVPTVLGIASIRVYTVSEAPADGLVPREKLSVYTVTQSGQSELVPEQPGVIQKGLTAARETIQPYVRSAQSACSSVKRGSVKLYHTGEDVFYYLKDPPPEFLPRFGTITMAGLLGMFLARKGSRFRRVALPLGLMGAGASVCYPAQAVGVVKVTAKKVFVAGQWSGAVLSSLFASKPQQPAADDHAAASSPLQETPGPNPQPALTKDTTGAESSEKSPVSEKPADAATSEQGSSSSSTAADPAEGASSTITASQEAPAAESPVESAPVELVPPVESAPVDLPPVDLPPVDLPPLDLAPPVESAPVDLPPLDLPPLDLPPVDLPPVDLPVETPPVEAEAVPAAPVESTPPSESSTTVEEVTDQPSVPVVESAEPLPESAEPTPVVAAASEEETSTTAATPLPLPPLPPPPPPTAKQPAAENSKGGSGFKADAALMDFGQSSPEDEDLYSTRS